MKQVLSQRGSEDRTIGIHEDWSWGPIGDARIADRIAFLEREAPTPWDDYYTALPEKYAEFWSVIAAWEGDRLIWIGSRSAQEAAGYLALLDRFSTLDSAVVRPDDHLPPHPRYGVAGATGVLNADKMAEVLDHAERRPIASDEQLFGRWQQLVREDAGLRILDDGGALVSAPADAHDRFILESLSPEWTWGVRIIRQAMGAMHDFNLLVSDQILFSRLAHLVRTGIVEADGDVLAWQADTTREKVMVRLAGRAG